MKFNTFADLAEARLVTGTPVTILEPYQIDGIVRATGEGLTLLSGNVFVPFFGDQEVITARKTSLIDDAFPTNYSAYINRYTKDNSGAWVETADGRTSAVYYGGQAWWPLVEVPYKAGGYLVTDFGLPTGNPDILELELDGSLVFQFNRFKGLVDGGTGGGSIVSETPPDNPLAGIRWTRCSDMKSFIWYVDDTSAQWVEDNPSVGAPLRADDLALGGGAVFASTVELAAGTSKYGQLVLETIQQMRDDGTKCRTEGFYSGSTIGGAEYIWLDEADKIAGGYADGISAFEFGSSGIFACLLIESSEVNISQLGGSLSDSKIALESAYSLAKNVNIDIDIEVSGGVLPTQGSVTKINNQITKRGTVSYLAGDGNSYNCLFVLNGSNSKASFCGNGTITDGDINLTTKVSTAECFLLDFCINNTYRDITISNFNYDFRPADRDFFGQTFKKVRVIGCENSFNFSTDRFKTTLNLDDIYLQNCGTTYSFRKTQYSSLSNCAADFINYKDASNPYDSVGRGNKGSARGIYTFESCSAITLKSCGAENSYCNGILYFNNSNLDVSGLKGFNLICEYIPNFGSLGANYSVGLVSSGTEAGLSNVTIRGLDITTYTNTTTPTVNQSIVAYNHSNGAYGDPDKYIVDINLSEGSSMAGLTTVVGGTGSVSNVKLSQDVNLSVPSYKKYRVKNLVGVSGTKIIIPFISNPSLNQRGLLKVNILNNVNNSTTPRSGEALINIAHLTTLTGGTGSISLVGNVASVDTNGLNLEINLVAASTTCLIYLEFMYSGDLDRYLDYDNISIN